MPDPDPHPFAVGTLRASPPTREFAGLVVGGRVLNLSPLARRRRRPDAQTPTMVDSRATDGVPYFFLGAPTVIDGPFDDVVLPGHSQKHDWEWPGSGSTRSCTPPDALRALVAAADADRVLLGSDHPFDMGVTDPVARLADAPAPPKTTSTASAPGTPSCSAWSRP